MRVESPKAITSNRIPVLDGWRAIAISLVVISHSIAWGTHLTQGQLHEVFVTLGHQGVNIFFALSGFLITSRLILEHQCSGRISLKGFYIRRVWRILPPYWTYLLFLGCLIFLGYLRPTRNDMLSCLLFWRNYLPYTNLTPDSYFTGHFWSLAVEEHFYVIWPTLLVVVGVKRGGLASGVFATGVALYRGINNHGRILLVALPVGENVRTDFRLDSLLWGCCLAFLVANREIHLSWRVSRLLLFALFAVYGALTFSELEKVIWAPLIPTALIAVTIVSGANPFCSFLSLPALQWLGRLSYSIYIWQQFFIAIENASHPLGIFQTVPLGIAATVAVAAASFYLIEQPCTRFGRRLAQKRSTSASAAVSGI
jgi:peptidoglycan/LPS O-acetylase OafA/YrhL